MAALALGGLATTLLAHQAKAQLLDQFLPSPIYGAGDEPAVTVGSRARSDYDNPGVRAGGVVVRPRLTESFGYETNVLGRSQAVGSALVQTSASLDAGSDLSNRTIGAGLSVDNVQYLSLANQSYTTWSARVGGTYNLGRDVVSLSVSHQNNVQTLRDLDTPQLQAPLEYTTDTARASYTALFSRFRLTPSVEVSRLRYDSGFANGFIYDQQYRNRVVVTPGATLAYELAPRRNAVLVVRNTSAFYDYASATQPRRNFDDLSVLGGLDYDLNGSFRVRALAGYETRTFSSSTFKTIESPIAEVTLIWTPSGLTSVTGILTRHIQDSADETTAASTTTAAKLRVDQELRRNILLAATAGIARNEFSGTDQTLYTADLGATYLLNRYAGVTANYDFSSRQSSSQNLNLNGFSAGANYTDHRFLLQVRLAL